MANDRLHRTCQKEEPEYAKCQRACDNDHQCKGFVLNKVIGQPHYCVLATTNDCLESWTVYNGWASGGPLSP